MDSSNHELSNNDIDKLLENINDKQKNNHPYYFQDKAISGNFAKEQLEIILKEIEKHENLGENSGGSGHLGYKTFTIKEINQKMSKLDGLKLIVKYATFTESEFTSYPDNPPYENQNEIEIIF